MPNKSARFAEISPSKNYYLLQRWPDIRLCNTFRDLFKIYKKISEASLEKSGNPEESMRRAYGIICMWIEASFYRQSKLKIMAKNIQNHEQEELRSLVPNLKESYGAEWLQSVASLLGMLMHFSVNNRGPYHLVNHRRPKKVFTTYPTSPAVAKLMGDAIFTFLCQQPIPGFCKSYVDAERYAERALNFRVIDPSMESGQLLLEVALASVRQIYKHHSPQSKAARYLIRALLKKLCRDCIWGIDRNELATRAVSLIFSLLGAEFSIKQLIPNHLITADSLECFNQGKLSQFNGIINNPPWGDTLTPTERKRLRARFLTLQYQSDTYVAFSELAIRCLRPGGIFALILPSQVIAAKNTSRLRELLLSRTKIEHMILLPRAAFANATARGFVFLGNAQTQTESSSCQVTTYPIKKSFNATNPVKTFIVSTRSLRRASEDSWWPLLNASDLKKFHAKTFRLEQLASIASGVKLYCKGRGVPPQTAEVVSKRPFTLSKPTQDAVPAIRGRDVRDFYLSCPQLFVKFGKWLAQVGDHELLQRSTRIFVRELCRRDGKLTAAVAEDGFIPLHGVLTVVPKMINIYTLVAILNSKMAAQYVRTKAASFSKVDFQKITISELRQMPIPISAISSLNRSALGQSPPTEHETGLLKSLTTLTRRLLKSASANDVNAKVLRTQIEVVVSKMYNPVEENGHA